MNSMICPQCGNEIKTGHQFCMNCGFSRPAQTAPTLGQPASRDFQGNTLKTPGYVIVLIVVSSILLLGALLYGAWRFFLDKPVTEGGKAIPNAAASASPAVLSTTLVTPKPLPSSTDTPVPTATPTPPPSVSDINVLYEQAAFAKFSDDPKWDSVVKRWETPIRVELIGDCSEADYNTVNDFLILLTERVPWLDIAFMEGEGDASGNLEIHFVAQSQMKDVIPGALPDDRTYYYLKWNDNAQLTKAQIALATDTLSQEERSHIIIEDIVHCLGLVGYLPDVPDSILYDQETTVKILSEADYTLIMMHYSAATYAGQSKAEALEALKNVS